MTELAISADTPVELVSAEKPKKKYLNPYWSNKDNRHLIVTIEMPNGQHSMASIMDPDDTNPDMKAVLDQYTEEEIDANTQEGLFNCKLEAFEVEAIKNSKNTELKRMIRKSKSVMEVQAYATILMMKEIENAEATD